MRVKFVILTDSSTLDDLNRSERYTSFWLKKECNTYRGVTPFLEPKRLSDRWSPPFKRGTLSVVTPI